MQTTDLLPFPPIPTPFHLHPTHKSQIDTAHLSFLIVFARLWPSYLRAPLSTFCLAAAPHLQPKEPIHAEVRRLLALWAEEKPSPEVVEGLAVLGGEGERELRWKVGQQARVIYERRVRRWHVGVCGEMYEWRCVEELRKMGVVAGL